MRASFRSFYRPSEHEFEQLWKTAIFTFDANFLLHVYRYSPKTQQKMLAILKSLGERVWIPHQAGLEFHRNCHKVIAKQVTAYADTKKMISEALTRLKDHLSKLGRHPFIDSDQLSRDLSDTCVRLVEKLDGDFESYPNLGEFDSLREALTEILDGKVGKPFAEARRVEVRSDAEKRHKQKIPPGFKDDEEREHPYGDYFVWRQLLDHALERQCPVIFTTDDHKEDWWLRPGTKTIGPRPELLQEMHEVTNQMFYMYRSDHFLELAGKRLGIEGSDDAVREVRTLREQDERTAASSTIEAAPGVDPHLVLGKPGRSLDGLGRGTVRPIRNGSGETDE